jgi:hypothetical protein
MRAVPGTCERAVVLRANKPLQLLGLHRSVHALLAH